jgi:hypothetical protein
MKNLGIFFLLKLLFMLFFGSNFRKFIKKNLLCFLGEIQETCKFYSGIFIIENYELEEQEGYVTYSNLPNSTRFIGNLLSPSVLFFTSYSFAVLFFPQNFLLVIILNYVWGVRTLTILIYSILEVLSSSKNFKQKFKDILSIIQRFGSSVLLIAVINYLSLLASEIIKFEKNLKLIEGSLTNVIKGKEKKEVRLVIRKRFYLGLGLLTVLYCYRHFGCKLPIGFSFGSESPSIDPTDQPEVPKTENNPEEEDTSFSLLMRFIGSQSVIDNSSLFDSLPDHEKEKVIQDYLKIKSENPNIPLIAAFLFAILAFFAVLGSSGTSALDRDYHRTIDPYMRSVMEEYRRRMINEEIRRQRHW